MSALKYWDSTTSSWKLITSGEAYLGTPSVDGYILSSTVAGVRSWIAPTTPTVPFNVYFYYTAGTQTYTPATGVKMIRVECFGGGGGGGGAIASAGTATCGAGGGGGGWASIWLVAPLKSSYTLTVGAAGAAGTAAGGGGGNGGNTSFDAPSVCTATGGIGGAGSATGGTVPAFPAGGGQGGAGTAGQFLLTGGDGMNGIRLSATQTLSGQGGNAARGGGNTKGVGLTIAGNQGAYWGGGGSGASSQTASGAAGGAGYLGLVMITEFF